MNRSHMSSKLAMMPSLDDGHYVIVRESKSAVAASESKAESKEEKQVVQIRTNGLKMSGKKGVSAMPPPILLTPVIRHVFRYRVTSAVTGQGCGLGGLLGATGGICTATNSNVRTWGSSLRIHSLKMWLPAGTSSDVGYIDWSSAGPAGFAPDKSKLIAVPDGVTVSSALSFTPPTGSLAAFWLNPTVISLGAAVFAITAPVGAIIDFDASFTLGVVNNGVDQTVVTGVLKQQYYLALEGAGTNKIRPLGLPTTS